MVRRSFPAVAGRSPACRRSFPHAVWRARASSCVVRTISSYFPRSFPRGARTPATRFPQPASRFFPSPPRHIVSGLKIVISGIRPRSFAGANCCRPHSSKPGIGQILTHLRERAPKFTFDTRPFRVFYIKKSCSACGPVASSVAVRLSEFESHPQVSYVLGPGSKIGDDLVGLVNLLGLHLVEVYPCGFLGGVSEPLADDGYGDAFAACSAGPSVAGHVEG